MARWGSIVVNLVKCKPFISYYKEVYSVSMRCGILTESFLFPFVSQLFKITAPAMRRRDGDTNQL